MTTINRTYFLLVLALLVTALVPQSSATTEGEFEDGYEFVWNTDMNITVYFPNSPTGFYGLGLSNEDTLTQRDLLLLEYHFEKNAWRDVNVYFDTDKNLLAANLMLTWSTDSNAISFADYRESVEKADRYNGINLLTTTNLTNPIVDVLPDLAEEEGDVSRSATDIAGTESQQYRNTTDIDTSTSVFIDLTNYNHSTADWLEMDNFKMSGAANATITVGYSNAAGAGGEVVTVLDTDQYISFENWFGYLPMPSSASYTYVNNITFSALELDEFRLYKWSAAYEDPRTNSEFEFVANTAAAVDLNGWNPISAITSKTKSAMKSFPVVKASTKVAQRGVGYLNIRESALGASAAALSVKYASIVDHRVNWVKDKVTIPAKLSKDILDGMETAWNNGETSAQALVREGRKHLKSATLTVGVAANKFGTGVDNAAELAGEVIKAVPGAVGKAATATTSAGKGMFDKAKDGLGRLPSKGAALFSKINPLNFLGKASNVVKYAIIAVVVIVVIVLFMKFAM